MSLQKTYTISAKTYHQLLKDSELLQKLEENGVDNWEGYQGIDDEEYSIFINGKEYFIDEKALSYNDIVRLSGNNKKVLYSITYSSNGVSGSLIPKESVTVEEGMHFNIYFTGNA